MTAQRTINIWHDGTVSCFCVNEHNPEPTTFDEHHIHPLSWGGPDVEDNVIVVCPTTHRNTHLLLNAWRRAGQEPAWEYRRKFSPFVRKLAEQGWVAHLAGEP